MRLVMLCATLSACATVSTAPPNPDADLKSWDEVTAGFTRHEGPVSVWSRSDGTTLLELRPADLDKHFGVTGSISRSTGLASSFTGMPLDSGRLISFRRVGRSIAVVHHTEYLLEASTANARPTGEVVLAVLPILSMKDEITLVDPKAWLLSDHLALAEVLKKGWVSSPEQGLSPDKERSFVERVQVFPRNLEADVTLTFVPPRPPPIPAVSPSLSTALSVGVRWSLYALPEQPMAARLADDRIGYFVSSQLDPHARAQPVIDRVFRWRLEKKNPAAASSPPVTPIVFHLDGSIPADLRPVVRDAVLEWNRAFEALGFTGAIEVRDAPKDLDLLDVRYSVIHWTSTADLGPWGYGPAQVDPRTGEILNADVTLNNSILTGLSGGRFYARPGGCAAGPFVGTQLSLAVASGRLDPRPLIAEAVRWTVLHEVGHTLGLRHNFRASANTPAAKLHDREWTAVHGLMSSVMDYPGLNLAPAGVTQGFFFTPTVGDYDRLAIKYGYGVGLDEKALAAIAAQATMPSVNFGTDEDAWLENWAVDPYTNGGDLGDDPLRWATDWVALIDRSFDGLPEAVTRDGESWADATELFVRAYAERTANLVNATKFVGGAQLIRGHRGDAVVPVAPVPAEQQRRALALVLDAGFGAASTRPFTPQLIARLPPRRGLRVEGALSAPTVVPVDPQVHTLVASSQRTLFDALLDPARLHRVIDNTIRAPTDALTLAELFTTITRSVFSELDAPRVQVGSFRRNTQRLWAARLLALVREPDTTITHGGAFMETPPGSYPPPDARSLARAELRSVAKRAQALAPRALDAETSAHLNELSELITRTLDAPPSTKE
ncbi:MAG: zinc-dependent metalloprotease [Archangium sp.]